MFQWTKRILKKQIRLLLSEMICLKQLPVGQNVKSAKKTTSKTPWRSSRVKKKPKWQESGDYCMGISKQLMMLQSLLSSSVIETLDPSVISAVTSVILC